MNYNFEWNTEKAEKNFEKHKVSFELAATIFLDPNAVSIYDEEHSIEEDRWITMGISKNGNTLTIIHTYNELEDKSVKIRIISARKSTKKEIEQYKG